MWLPISTTPALENVRVSLSHYRSPFKYLTKFCCGGRHPLTRFIHSECCVTSTLTEKQSPDNLRPASNAVFWIHCFRVFNPCLSPAAGVCTVLALSSPISLISTSSCLGSCWYNTHVLPNACFLLKTLMLSVDPWLMMCLDWVHSCLGASGCWSSNHESSTCVLPEIVLCLCRKTYSHYLRWFQQSHSQMPAASRVRRRLCLNNPMFHASFFL